MILIAHVLISLIALAAGFPFVAGLLKGRLSPLVRNLFLSTTALTSLTGFLFPFHGITPGIVFGVLTLVLLSLALKGSRKAFVIGTMTSLYLNWIVFFVQLGSKTGFPGVPAAQLLLLAAYLFLTRKALRQEFSTNTPNMATLWGPQPKPSV